MGASGDPQLATMLCHFHIAESLCSWNFDFRCINSAMAKNSPSLTEGGLKQPPTLHPQRV